MKYPVLAPCGVDDKLYKAGDVIDLDQVSGGSRDSLLRLHVLGDPLPEPKIEEVAQAGQPDQPTDDKKKR